jgi:hypothetical protein
VPTTIVSAHYSLTARINTHLVGARMETNAVACLTDFHEIVWQHALYNLRDSVEHLADIENVRKRVARAVENFKARSKNVLLRRLITKMVLRTHGRGSYLPTA